MKTKIRLLSALLVLAFNVEAHEAKVVIGLKTPESALARADGQVYVSEIGEFGKDGDGQITLIDTKGQKTVFASGMDDPKGLAMIGKFVYVADKTRVLKVAPDGKWSVFAGAEAFPIKPQFLNDLATDPAGNLYVSDSGDLMNGKGGGAIFRINSKGQVTTIIDSKEPRIQSPNGLLLDDTGNILLEVDFATGLLYSYNMKSKTLTELAQGFGGADGLVDRANGLLYVSDWKNGKVFSVKHDEVTLLKDGFKSAADIAITHDGKYLLVPDMKAGELHYLPLH